MKSRVEVARVQVNTAVGGFMVAATARGLRAVTPVAMARDHRVGATANPASAREPALHHAEAAADALRRYARGEHARYDGPLDIEATALHLAVWGHLRSIAFGETTTYGAVATALGLPGEARAIGVAVGANPVCILVPCHRVVGADGSLRGFAWGLDLKRRLLAHEGSAALSLFADATGR